MKILVTGAGGYIGTTLVPSLLKEGHQVIAVDRFFFGKERLEKHENLEFVFEDSRKIPKILFENVDAVIDLVAISNDPSGEIYQKQTYEINHESRVRTAKLAKQSGVKKDTFSHQVQVYMDFKIKILLQMSHQKPIL